MHEEILASLAQLGLEDVGNLELRIWTDAGLEAKVLEPPHGPGHAEPGNALGLVVGVLPRGLLSRHQCSPLAWDGP